MRKGKAVLWCLLGGVLVLVFGSLLIVIDRFVEKNYWRQFELYNSITLGMSKQEVQNICGQGMPVILSAADADSLRNYEKADDIMSYKVILSDEPGCYFSVFYDQNRVIDKAAYYQDRPIFTREEIEEKKKNNFYSILITCAIISTGLVSFIVLTILSKKRDLNKLNAIKWFYALNVIALIVGWCSVLVLFFGFLLTFTTYLTIVFGL